MADADVMDRPASVPELAAKSEFAKLCGVTPGRVSQWIAEGKIEASSLSGEGRSAKVIVRAAVGDLVRRLDVSQSAGLNGLASRLKITHLAPPSGAAGSAPEPDQGDPDPRPSGSGDLLDDLPTAPAPRPRDDTTEQIARQKLRQAELATLRQEREEALEAGKYVLAEDARAQIGRTATTVLTAVEGGFNTMADALCARFPELPRRDVVHVLATSFREVREKAAKSFAEQREAALAVRRQELEADEE